MIGCDWMVWMYLYAVYVCIYRMNNGTRINKYCEIYLAVLDFWSGQIFPKILYTLRRVLYVDKRVLYVTKHCYIKPFQTRTAHLTKFVHLCPRLGPFRPWSTPAPVISLIPDTTMLNPFKHPKCTLEE